MLIKYIQSIGKNHRLIFSLAANDCKARFASSKMGVFWAFAQPIFTIIIFWFVYQIGFNTNSLDGVPFVFWYVPAFLAINFFNEALSQSTGSILEYKYLIKKIGFDVSIIPIIKIVASMMIHTVFIILIFILSLLYRQPITIHSIQIIYYWFGASLLLMGLGWICSSINVFSRDTSGIVNILLQVFFWASPIIWSTSQISDKVLPFLKINPLFYICEGYRNCFVYHEWFWNDIWYTCYFWAVVVIVLIIGSKVYSKLTPYFDDVL